jgi:hypothetical protein
MKFYRKTEQHLFNGTFADEKLIYICSTYYFVDFCKNNTYHNTKNAAYVHDSSYKEFYLNGKCYGTNNDFTKNLWRKFVKMQVFL